MSNVLNTLIIGSKNQRYRIDRVNGSLTYFGRSGRQGIGDSDVGWQIIRLITVGNVESVDYAGSSNDYDKIWSARTAYNYGGISAPPYSNTLSTLFDGINDYCTAGDAFNYEHSQQFSVALWIKPNNFAATRYFIGNVDTLGTVYGWRIGVDTAGNINLQTRSNGGAYGPTAFTDITLTSMQWHHIVFTWGGGSNNNQGRIWVDGVQSAIVPTSGSLTTSWLASNELRVGAAPTNYFSGNINQVTMWNKVLSGSEISELFNAGVPVNPSTVSYAANLINHYKMGDGDAFPTIYDLVGPSEDLTMINMTSGSFVLDVP